MEFNTIKTNEGCYIQLDHYGRYNENNLLFDGVSPTKTFDQKWYYIKDIPKKVTCLDEQLYINHRYELKDKSIVSEKFPLVFCKDDVTTKDGDFTEEFSEISSLYKYVYDTPPRVEVELDVKFIIVADVVKVVKPSCFDYDIMSTGWLSNKKTFKFDANELEYSLMDKIVFPPILLPQRPCMIKSKDLYNIIRAHIKKHIDNRYAKITSDYDFCFTVKKSLSLSEYEKQDVNKNKNKTKKNRYITEREHICFEMTNKEDAYKGYIPLEDLYGENQEDLKSKIDNMCEDILTMINEPLVSCPHCYGRGAIIQKDEK